MDYIDKYRHIIASTHIMITITKLIELLKTEFPFNWSLPPDLSKGILTTNQAFVISKELNQSPQDVATELADKIQKFLDKQNLNFIAKGQGPYINIDFSETGLQEYFYRHTVEQIIPDDTDKILVEYFAPNVGKKMHIGNIRTANIGESLRRILSLKYISVISNNHLGDWGIQFGFLIWGIQNIDKLGLGVYSIDWKLENSEIVALFQKIYVKVNKLSESDENIRKQCQQTARALEQNFGQDPNDKLELLWKNIINASIESYTSAEGYLGLNVGQNSENKAGQNNLQLDSFSGKDGLWLYNKSHQNGQFDTIIGESFYLYFMDELRKLADSNKVDFTGLDFIKREGEAIYADLEAEGLGRCYLISSDGYSIYAARDVIARFVWAGLFGTSMHISLADNRQSHTFQQSFMVIRKIVESKYYQSKNFGILSVEQTQQALLTLEKDSLKHVSFGFMSLPDGAMSTRKGTVLLFETVKNLLEKEVHKVLLEKSPETKINSFFNQKVQKIAVAALKWQDLSKDRDQDIVFDVQQVTKFEGNTGVYQLYTLARISNILVKNETSHRLEPESVVLLNAVEQDILKKMSQLPYAINGVIDTLKPHILCTYLFEFCTMVNSWYAEYSVARESDPQRRDALLHLCFRMKIHIAFCLTLLGIEPIESL